MSDTATNRDSRLTIPAGAVLPHVIIIKIKNILTFDNVMITSAVDAETGFCYTKLMGKSGEPGRFIDAPVAPMGMELVPGADRGPRAGSPHGVVDATGFEPAITDPVATAPGTDFTVSTEPHDRSAIFEDESEQEKYLLCSNGTVLGFSALEKTKSAHQRTGRFFPSDDYFEVAEIFEEFPQSENDWLEANVREGYGLTDEDAPAFRKKFNDLCERIDALKLYVADEDGQQIPAAEIKLEDLSRFYRDESERWLHVEFAN